MADIRKDYGPAGCADGCATRGAALAIWALVALLKPSKGNRRA